MVAIVGVELVSRSLDELLVPGTLVDLAKQLPCCQGFLEALLILGAGNLWWLLEHDVQR